MNSLRRFVPFAFIAFICSTLNCYAFKPGYYKGDPEFSAIWKTAATADRVLKCTALDEIDVGIGGAEEMKDMPGVIGRDPKYFARKDVHYFLKSEKHKDFLVIEFGKEIRYPGPENVKKTLEQFKVFVSDLGYKRVLILGLACMGVFVHYDSAEKPDQKAPDAMKKGPAAKSVT